LLGKELRELWLGSAMWAALLIDVLLTGYSYIQAANLYAEPSRAATKVHELARGLSPLDGIVVPTFGALYLVVTFLFPFVVIRTIGAEKQHGSDKLLVQLPYSMPVLLAAKLVSVLVAWLILLLPGLTALGFWLAANGHVGAVETSNVILGHFLYCCVIISISLAAAAVTHSVASAGIVALSVTLGFWVLDFAAAYDDGLLKTLASFSMTSVLRTFEHGIFSLPNVLASLFLGLAGTVIAGVWFHPGQSLINKVGSSIVVTSLALIAVGTATSARIFYDATEDRRNSFGPADDMALRRLDGHLKVTVYLAPTDPRLYDLERSILSKLRRTMPRVDIAYQVTESDHGLSTSDTDRYGEVTYEYDGRQAISRSTSEDEILPLVFQIAEAKRPLPRASDDYPGYPLVASTHAAAVGFYFVGPVIVLFSWGISQGALRLFRSPKVHRGLQR
jgi:ABC-type transport system involved in multi-copper enzyme maturation permease subunit